MVEVVRRILDRRPFLIVADGGLSLSHFGYVENVAHALLLAVDKPKVAAGQVYNCGDQEVLTIAQVAGAIAKAMGHEWELVSMPWEIAWPARPLVAQPWTTHRIVSLAKLESELGYRDLVPPREALARTARWSSRIARSRAGSRKSSCKIHSTTPRRTRSSRRTARRSPTYAEPTWAKGEAPGFGLAYSGPGGRARSQATFEG